MRNKKKEWAYRMIIILQLLVPVVLITGSFFVPESPRWLIGQGRDQEAVRVLKFLRKGTPSEVVEQEAGLLVAAEEDNRRNLASASFLECFRGTNLRRTLICTGVQCLQQAQGASFMSSYAVVFLQQIGISDTYKIQVLLIFTMCISSAFAFYFPDKFGRRWIMIGSSLIMAASMFTVAGVAGYQPDNAEAMKGALGMLFVWWFIMAIGWCSW
jgi:SP family sugar:H+ symporter-like MFS transporter